RRGRGVAQRASNGGLADREPERPIRSAALPRRVQGGAQAGHRRQGRGRAAKVQGAPPRAPQGEQGGKVVDLMEALRASVEATRKKPSGQTDGEAPATRTRTISARRRKSA